MSVLTDAVARDRIARTALGETLFVEAGAGSGKTTQLVDRVVSLVLVDGVEMADIAAITFTEAAATELRSRVRKALETRRDAEIRDGEGGPHGEVVTRCQRAIVDLDLAAISTLHAFAGRVLGEHAVAAGLPPKVHVLDEVASQMAFEERWDRFVDELYDDPRLEPLLVRCALTDIPIEPRYTHQATLKDVAHEFSQNWDLVESMPLASHEPLPPIDFAPFDQAVDALESLADSCADPDDKLCLHIRDTVLPLVAPIRAMVDDHRKLAAVSDGDVKKISGGGKGRAANWGDGVAEARAAVSAVGEAAEGIVGVSNHEVLRRLGDLVAGHVLESADARRRAGGLEFHDLLVLARKMLRARPDIRTRLRDRYRFLLLDEFQDTDPIQIELAALIASEPDGDAPPSPWDELEVDAGRLFFVGDPKQSIYRFRRADIELFLAARDRFGAGDGLARLTTNFRTVEPILDWVNGLFGERMADEVPARQPAYVPLVAHRPADSGRDHRPLMLGGAHADDRIKAGPLREAEAADVVSLIADIRRRPHAWPVHDDNEATNDPDRGGWRPARLSDVTVLVPTRTSLPFLRAELERAEVPYRLATGTLVYDTQEVRDALAALRTIDDPTDELSLIAALRSPLYACSDVDLFTYRQAGGRWDLRRSRPEAIGPDHPVAAAFAHLRSLWEQRWWLTPSALLDRLLTERHAHLLAFGDPRPADVWRRLRFLVDQARAFEESEVGDLRAFLRWAELQSSDLARVHEPLLPETDDDALRILTIHGAKGLEFPITILTGLTTQLGRTRSGVSVLWGPDGRPAVKLASGKASANHEPRADLEAQMDAHERDRLLYVATTRARDHLVVSCHHKAGNAEKTYGGIFAAFAEAHPDLVRRVELPPATPTERLDRSAAGDAQTMLLPFDDREAWIERRNRLLAQHRIPRVRSATAIAKELHNVDARSGTPDPDDDRADQPEETPATQRRQGRAGSAIGSAVHAVLQVIDFDDHAQLDTLVRQQCEIEAIPDMVPTVAALVRAALASDAVALARQQPHHRELFVAAPVGGRTIEGYVDLLVETPDGLVVVDYKTDSARTEAEIDERMTHYEAQGAAYAVAIETVTGSEVVDCRFVFCKTGGAVERSVTDLRDVMARVRDVVTPRIG